MTLTGYLPVSAMARRNRPLAEVESWVKLRVGRRETLTRRNAPEYIAFIGEQALRQGIGGAEVMADQLRFVLKLNEELDNVTILVVPIGNGAHDGLSGQFELYEFPDTAPSVLLEHVRSSLFLSDDDDGDDVKGFKDATEELRRAALSVDDSRALMAEIASDYERTKNGNGPHLDDAWRKASRSNENASCVEGASHPEPPPGQQEQDRTDAERGRARTRRRDPQRRNLTAIEER